MHRKAPDAKILLIQAATLGLDSAKSRPALPLSLLCAVNLVAGDFPVEIFDQRQEALTNAHIERWRRESFLCIGVTGLTGPEIGSANKIVARLRQITDAPIVWGGKHASMFPQFLIEAGRADIVVIGEGEWTFLHLARALRDHTPWQDIPGLAFRDPQSGAYRQTPAAETVDLNRMPALPYHLLAHAYLFDKWNLKTSTIETSRGCPYQCHYCYHSHESQKSWHAGGADWTLERIRQLKQTFPDVGYLAVQDDNYFIDRSRNIELAEKMIAAELVMPFTAAGSIRDFQRMSDDDLALLARSGLAQVEIGIETLAPRLQEEINKKQTAEEILSVCHRLNHHSVRIWGNILVGFEGETPTELDYTLHFVRRLKREIPRTVFSPFYVYTPYPGTCLCRKMEQKGYRLPTMQELEEVSWSRPISPWLSKRQRKFYGRLYFYTLFIDDKILDFRNKPWTKFLLRLFQPIARWRVFHRRMELPLEKWIFDHLVRISY